MTQAPFWTEGVDESKVIGGPARVLVAKRSEVSYPFDYGDVLNLTTYLPVAPWQDLGHTNAPFASSDGFDTTEWVSQQVGIINRQIGNWNRTITIQPMQGLTDLVMEIVHGADPGTSDGGDTVHYMWDKSDLDEWRVVAIHLSSRLTEGANLVMDVFPNAKRSGGDSETAWDREAVQSHTLEMTPFPDSDVPNSANWYRIQPIGV